MDLSYIINELGEDRDEYFRAIAPPIVQTSNFAFKTVDGLRKSFEDEYTTFLYSRGLNPTVEILRKKLAALDCAEDCLVFNSGAAAIFASVFANIKSGDHIISVKNPYTWAQRLFDVILPRFQVTVTYVDGTLTGNFEAAIKANTRLIYLESPNSWFFELQDLEAVAALAKKHGIITVCDNSFGTPVYQQPISLGIDMVLQSATKYIGGHSDTVGGVLCGNAAMIKKIFHSEYLNIGSGIQPFNAWLLLRGLRTLPTRLEQVGRTTVKVLAFLKTHPQIEKVYFPFDQDFPQYALAKKQMSGACGLITFILKASSMAEMERFCETLKKFLIAVSWGGYESLILPRCAGIKPEAFEPADPVQRSVRIYVGLESEDYLIADLKSALEAMKSPS